MCLSVGHQHSQFWPILVRFMDYYSPFWGPSAISTIDDPLGVLTCRSSTLVVLANSGPFRGLLLTVFVSQSDFHVCRTQGALICRSSTLAVFVDADPFHGLLLNFGVPKRFPWLSNPGVRLHVGHQHSQIWPILVRLLDYYSPFSSPEVISTLNEPRGAFTCR